MHAKHRNGPGNGHRSNTMGMGGVAAASRIPPEGSMRGYRMYNSEYRNYNRGGYGSGGHPKQYQPPLPPQRETDIFMEAGRMAAEYLVSKGMLPPNALSGKWQSDGLKNQVGNFQGYKSNEAEKIQSSVDGRASAHSRLGNAALDVGSGRRKYSDEYNSVGSRTSIRGIERGRKRTGSFKNYGSEVSRELGRSGSLTDKIRTFHGPEAESDASFGHYGDQPAGKDGNCEMLKSSPDEPAREIESETQMVSGLEKRNLVEDADVNNSILSNEKCLTSDASAEATKKPDNESELVKAVNSDNELQQKNDEKKEVASSGIEDTLVSEDHVDLVKQCKFVNVPTKARSSLTMKGLKGDQNPIKEEDGISKREPLEDTGVHIIDVDVENLAGNAATHQNHELKSLPSDDPTLEKEMNITYSTRSAPSMRSESFAERSLYKEQQQDEGLSGFGRSKSMLMERGEKRAIDCNPDGKDDFKKLRQWVPLQDAQSISSPPISSSIENKPLSQEPSTSQSAHLAPSLDHNSLDISLFPKDNADSSKFMQEKQLFPSSFKTCDLNLVGASDVNENHDADPMHVFPSITQTGKAAKPIDVDLSMGNNGNMSNKTGKYSVNEKDIEVIDLEKESAHEDKTYGNSDRRGDTVFTDLDGFPNNVHNANGMPDVQDGYGLMISELLGSDSPNCSSVPTDLNSLHNHMALPNAEGILGDDDSIYMSLGEIPISMLGAWEQPSQDYGKPF
ncbi:uncharacterized protein At4g26450 [Salvia miltiorrhiza]|uniref:uncharacterized protein At4g26450 n=1 Tax=Salvia miltiorrhiza TaxID=226208 RepID=UPI0025ACA3A2|nr:uncharacterized protein At4g26450 [Salvia miltiorrhiza]XP_057765349.1 uncharacterized protein At4g26450 [Salvia miltiorrhiza]XP_057765350.1 uncharacterized protein At4g26450 [Salvia miltiorrhiza]